MKDTRAIQERLRQLGFNPGKVDGINGTKTKAAVKAFQIANGLAADGIAGPLTQAALFPVKVERPEGAPVKQPSRAVTEWPRQKDCMEFYGAVGLHQVKLELPYPMWLAWDKKVVINRFSIHKKVHDSAARVFDRIGREYSEADRKRIGLDLFGGCLNVRTMRGGSTYSMHSWGIAIDFDPERNQLNWGRGKARLAQADALPFWRFWEEEGWVSLGRARNFDWMHVQAARL